MWKNDLYNFVLALESSFCLLNLEILSLWYEYLLDEFQVLFFLISYDIWWMFPANSFTFAACSFWIIIFWIMWWRRFLLLYFSDFVVICRRTIERKIPFLLIFGTCHSIYPFWHWQWSFVHFARVFLIWMSKSVPVFASWFSLRVLFSFVIPFISCHWKSSTKLIVDPFCVIESEINLKLLRKRLFFLYSIYGILYYLVGPR